MSQWSFAGTRERDLMAMVQWEVKLKTGQMRGPFSEQQIRSGLTSGKLHDGMFIRQGGSEWMPAEKVREVFAALLKQGYYVKDATGRAFGPFTKDRIFQMDRARKLPSIYWIRQGEQGAWTEIKQTSKTSLVPPQQPEPPPLPPQIIEVVPPKRPQIPAAPVMKLRSSLWASLRGVLGGPRSGA